MPEPGGPGGPLAPPQYLADQLTLFKPGVGRLCPPLPLAPQSFSPSGTTDALLRFHKILDNPERT